MEPVCLEGEDPLEENPSDPSEGDSSPPDPDEMVMAWSGPPADSVLHSLLTARSGL